MKKTILMVAAALMSCMTGAWAQSEATAQTETTATCGQTVIITATADAGYKFLYWSDDPTNTNPEREVEVNAEMELITNFEAVFGAASYKVVVTTEQPDMGKVSGSGEFTYGEQITIKAEPLSKCYKFKQWSDGNTDAERMVDVAATDEKNTYTAIFEEVEFTVKVSTQGNGSVTIKKKIEN